jgi:NAD(P)-dependent dehydrogenase (short-subunit alcohol dehydrogenase family)
VTGSTSGIGLGIAKALAEQGVNVVLRRPQRREGLAKKLDATAR